MTFTLKGAALALGFAVFGAAPAFAVTQATFFFGGHHANLGSSEVYSSGHLDVTAHAFNLSKHYTADIRRSTYGIGVDTDPGRHSDDGQSGWLDDIGNDEALVFHFDPRVSFQRIKIYFNDWNDDLNFFATNDDEILNSTGRGEGRFASLAESSILNTGNLGAGFDWFDLSSLAGTWEYLAIFGGYKENNRALIKKLEVEYTKPRSDVEIIPVPLGLPLIASAFGLALFLKRRAA